MKGTSFLGLLQLLFIGLKLGGVIQWSWWLVMLPSLATLGLSLALLIVVFFAALVANLIKHMAASK